MFKNIICAVLVLSSLMLGYAQNKKSDNSAIDYSQKESKYREGASKSKNRSEDLYNLGNSIYKQEAYDESKDFYINAIEKSVDKSERHKAFHNLGNVLMKEKNYSGAVEAYKNALRNNPKDQQTRYNLALAKEMLDKNPPPDNQNDKNNQNQNQNNQNQNNQNQNQDNNNAGNDESENQSPDQGENQKDTNPYNQQKGMSKQHIENMLKAVENQEKGTQKKVKNKQELEEKDGQRRQTDKDW